MFNSSIRSYVELLPAEESQFTKETPAAPRKDSPLSFVCAGLTDAEAQ